MLVSRPARDNISVKVIYHENQWHYFKEGHYFKSSPIKWDYCVFVPNELGEIMPYLSRTIAPLHKFIEDNVQLYIVCSDFHPVSFKCFVDKIPKK